MPMKNLQDLKKSHAIKLKFILEKICKNNWEILRKKDY